MWRRPGRSYTALFTHSLICLMGSSGLEWPLSLALVVQMFHPQTLGREQLRVQGTQVGRGLDKVAPWEPKGSLKGLPAKDHVLMAPQPLALASG